MILSTDGATSGEGDVYVSKSGASLETRVHWSIGFHAGMSEQTRNISPYSDESVEGRRVLWASSLASVVPGLQPMKRQHGVVEASHS